MTQPPRAAAGAANPPGRDEPRCRRHRGQLAHNCGPCRSEQVAAPDGQTRRPAPVGADRCLAHPDQRAGYCAACRSEELAG